MKKGRKIALIIGSEITFKDCWGGLQLLKNCEPEITVTRIYVKSKEIITSKIQRLLTKLSNENIDTIIIASKNAHYLSSRCDDILRNILHNTRTTIIGASFTGGASLNDSKIPNQAIFGNGKIVFNDSEGFMDACMYAVDEEFPEIKLYEPEKMISLSLDKALEIAAR